MYLLDLRDRMRGDLERLHRLSWAREEFARLEGTKWADEDPASAFLRVKGARDLTRRELAVLRELVPWRDDLARAMDRATFRVVGNEQLLDIAREQPGNRDALSKIRGLSRGVLEKHARDILEAVRRGLAVPETELRRAGIAIRASIRVSARSRRRETPRPSVSTWTRACSPHASDWKPWRAGTRSHARSSTRWKSYEPGSGRCWGRNSYGRLELVLSA
jgi:ribonuclease D